MKKYMKLATSLLMVIHVGVGCKKSGGKSRDTTLKDTALYLQLNSIFVGNGYDPTSRNYLYNLTVTTSLMYRFFSADNHFGGDSYKIRYLGQDELMDSLWFMDNREQCLLGSINPNMQGKPLFEVTDLKTGKIYDTIFASSGTVQVEYCFGWYPVQSPGDILRLFNGYISAIDTLKYSESN